MKSFHIGIATSASPPGAASPLEGPRWTATWVTSPAAVPVGETFGVLKLPPRVHLRGTIRYKVRVSLGGTPLRLRFSNEYGDTPLRLEAVTVGISANGFSAAPASLRQVSFGGHTAITLPPGATAVSDSVSLTVSAHSDLLISVYTANGVPAFERSADFMRPGQATVEGADDTMTEHFPENRCLFTIRPLLSEVDVLTTGARRVVVTLGDSITDGMIDSDSGERGWPGALSRRLAPSGTSVVNAGIAGNRLLVSMPIFGNSALSRLYRDVLTVPGITHLVVLEGINDIGLSGPASLFSDTPLVQPEEMISAYSQIAARAREHGIKVIGATMLPFEGAFFYSTEKEAVRRTVNHWVQTSNAFDAVIDFDIALRDPKDTGKLAIDYDSGDHLHPSAAGYRRMSDTVDVGILK